MCNLVIFFWKVIVDAEALARDRCAGIVTKIVYTKRRELMMRAWILLFQVLLAW